MTQGMTDLAQWYTQPLGQFLWREEQKQVMQLLDHLLDHLSSATTVPLNVLQLGVGGAGECIYPTVSSQRVHSIAIQADPCTQTQGLYAEAEALPFLDACIEVVVLPHVLEFAVSPHQVLREAKRVLVAEGYVVIVGFTTYSIWGLGHWLLRQRGKVPWCGQFLSGFRLNDWLELLDFEVVALKHCFFRPPLQSQRLLSQLDRFDWIERHLPFMAADYIVVARKRVLPLTPIRPRWHRANALFAGGAIPEPSTRNRHLGMD